MGVAICNSAQGRSLAVNKKGANGNVCCVRDASLYLPGNHAPARHITFQAYKGINLNPSKRKVTTIEYWLTFPLFLPAPLLPTFRPRSALSLTLCCQQFTIQFKQSKASRKTVSGDSINWIDLRMFLATAPNLSAGCQSPLGWMLKMPAASLLLLLCDFCSSGTKLNKWPGASKFPLWRLVECANKFPSFSADDDDALPSSPAEKSLIWQTSEFTFAKDII